MAFDDLEVEREVGDRAEEGEADDEADRAGGDEDAVVEELERQDRLGRAAFDEGEDDEEPDAGDYPKALSGPQQASEIVSQVSRSPSGTALRSARRTRR
jgi:hypothetical protein